MSKEKIIERFKTERTRIFTKMFETENEHGLYDTTMAYQELDALVEGLLESYTNSKQETLTVEKAGVIAVDISDNIKPELTAQEQAFFVAGFQECAKYLAQSKENYPKQMSDENLEKLGEVADDLESLVAGLEIPMSGDFHVEQLKVILPKKTQILKDVYINEKGENPWD